MHPKERSGHDTDTPAPSKISYRPFAPNTDSPTPSSYYPSLVESGGKGRAFPVFTLILCISAIFLEGTAHLCASIFEMDPIPSPVMLLLYILTVVTVGVNQWVLTAGQGSRGAAIRQSPRGLGLLIVSTIVSLVVAITAGYMFLPLAPVGGILLLAAGLGMLLWTPYFAIISLIGQLRSLIKAFQAAGAERGEVIRTTSAATLAAVALLFWQIGRPMIAANYISRAFRTDGAEQRRNLEASRPFGGATILLDLAYKRNPSYWACLGYNAPYHGWWPTGGYKVGGAFSLWEGNTWWGSGPDTLEARRLYFLLTGMPFELAPAPVSFRNNPGTMLWRAPSDVAVEETGGLVVGRKIAGLWLAESRIEGQLSPDKSNGVVEWTMKFKNDTDLPQEARADIIIPEDAVVHKVSLWINGVEQPARYGHPNRVRQAYQQVAVVQRRDPLLVTMPAPGHVLAQCFPVPAKGEMQIRLGFTQRALPDGNIELPALGMVNFDVSHRTRGEWRVAPASSLPNAKGEVRTGRSLFLPNYAPGTDPADRKDLTAPASLYVVVDGSEGMNDVWTDARVKALEEALSQLTEGSEVRFFRTDQPDRSPVRWSRDGGVVREFVRAKSTGGYDPAFTLANALNLAALERERPAAVVFLHGASANGVTDLTAIRKALQLDYWTGPALVGVHMVPATPDALIRELSGFPRVSTRRAFPESPNFAAQLKSSIADAARLAGNTSSESNARNEVELVNAQYADPEKLTDPIHRLRLFEKVLSSWRYANTLPTEKALDVRIAVGKVAARRKMVTPLSSAVVLETVQQYKEHGLEKDDVRDPRKLKSVPNTSQPEPGALLLVLAGGLAAYPLFRRTWKTKA